MTKPYDDVRDSIMGTSYYIEHPGVAAYIPAICRCGNPIQISGGDCEFPPSAEELDDLLAGIKGWTDVSRVFELCGWRLEPRNVWTCSCNGCLHRPVNGRPIKYCSDECRKAAAAERRKAARKKM